jgi:cell division protease FtsH
MKKSFTGIAPLIITMLLLFFAAGLLADGENAKSMSYTELIAHIESGDVASIELASDSSTAIVLLVGDSENSDEIPVNIPSREAFTTYVQDAIKEGNDVDLKLGEPSMALTLLDYVTPIGLVLMLILFWVFMMQTVGGGKGAMSFTKSRAKLFNPDDKNKITFKDVAGLPEEREELQEIVEFLKYPKKFIDMGARIPKGVLLVGQPGTGKTLLAKAVAGEAGVPFYSISGSDFVEMYVGVGASRVRELFGEAKSKGGPCIIFIDEIDAVGRQRGAGLGGGHDEREQTLNQLLVEMDGFNENSGIIIIAATNRSDVLDPALLRPGRFDRQIIVNLPDKKGREEILRVHARNKFFESDVNFANIAKRTPGFSGAELENTLNEAAILAVRANKTKISKEDIDEAIDRVMGGPAKKSRIITAKEKKLIAYHEAGHATVGLKVEKADIVQKVTIIPRGDAGGYVLMTPEQDTMLQTRSELLDRITGLLAGRVSEEIFFDDITTGAHNDIEKATRIARLMVTELGMSSLGTIQYEQQTGSAFLGRDYANTRKSFSSQVAYEIDQEVRKIIDECYSEAKRIIIENIEVLHKCAELLLEKEKITGEEFAALFPAEV